MIRAHVGSSAIVSWHELSTLASFALTIACETVKDTWLFTRTSSSARSFSERKNQILPVEWSKPPSVNDSTCPMGRSNSAEMVASTTRH